MKTTFEQLVKLMVRHDVAKIKADSAAAQVHTNLAEYLEQREHR
jgi:GDPmannose 4,6-dehydratase